MVLPIDPTVESIKRWFSTTSGIDPPRIRCGWRFAVLLRVEGAGSVYAVASPAAAVGAREVGEGFDGVFCRYRVIWSCCESVVHTVSRISGCEGILLMITGYQPIPILQSFISDW